jgi:Photosynthesis system II assembly factor YCF48/Putative zinc-finger
MQQLPKLVQARLNKLQPTSHPDADQLTAFAEHALRGDERKQVLEHLAACAECREVLSVAQVQLPSGSPVKTPASRLWFPRPVLRWATAAALVVLAGSAAIVTRHWKSVAPAPATAKVEVKAPVLNAGRADLQLATPEKELDQLARAQSTTVQLSKSDGEPSLRTDKTQGLKAKLPSRARKAEDAESGSSPGLVATMRDIPALPAAPAQSRDRDSLKASSSKAFETRSENLEVTADAIAVPAPTPPTLAPTGPAAATAEVSKAKKAVSPSLADKDSSKTGAGNYLGVASVPAAPPRVASPAATLSWAISADGALQRSLDSGKTWQTVVVAGSPVFRTVSAVGPDIWAGGSAGLLYHSADAGQRWVRVQPATAETTLKGDVVRLEFTDVQHGQLTTADHEIWTTSDSGQSWQVLRR